MQPVTYSERPTHLCHKIPWRWFYYSYLHSIMAYRTIFWGNSSYSINIFRLQI